MQDLVEYGLCLETHTLYKSKERNYKYGCLLTLVNGKYFVVPRANWLLQVDKVVYLPVVIDNKRIELQVI